MFGFCKRKKLEKQLMDELKSLAGVTEFPASDKKDIDELLATYNKGEFALISLAVLAKMGTIQKYPDLYRKWDSVIMKYHMMGLFPKWKV